MENNKVADLNPIKSVNNSVVFLCLLTFMFIHTKVTSYNSGWSSNNEHEVKNLRNISL